MKTLLCLLAAATVFGTAAPASAFPPYIPQPRMVGYRGGVPAYGSYRIVGYDRMGQPIYQWVNRPVIGRSYGYRSYNYRPTYVRPPMMRGHHFGPVSHGHGHHHR